MIPMQKTGCCFEGVVVFRVNEQAKPLLAHVSEEVHRSGLLEQISEGVIGVFVVGREFQTQFGEEHEDAGAGVQKRLAPRFLKWGVNEQMTTTTFFRSNLQCVLFHHKCDTVWTASKDR
jgi:hypothetical protein